MKVEHVLQTFAEEHISNHMRALDMALPFFDHTVRDEISVEQKSLMQTARELDDALNSLIERCHAAKHADALVLEMRRLRIQGLQFYSFLHASRRLLHVASRRLAAKAIVDTLEREMIVLAINRDQCDVDRILEVAARLAGKRPKQFTRANELRLFVRAILLPFISKTREVVFGQAGRDYAIGMRQMFSSATKRIYKEQSWSLVTVLWRVLQPTIVPSIVGFVIVFLIHIALERGGIHFLRFEWWAFLVLIASYLFDKVFERIFENWHLKRYRKSCIDTASRLYLTEIRARSAMLGLVACRSEFVSAQAAAGVRVFPLDRASVGRVGVDVTTELASQVRDGGENAAGDDLAFDLGEPDLDLVEP